LGQLICPNCGASNSTKATFCRRCRQRLPADGLASGVTYPRRRQLDGGGGGGSGQRLAIYAAIFLAVVAFVVGALLVGFGRPSSPASTTVANVSPTPTLPPFEQPTPDPTPTPEVTPAASPSPTPLLFPTATPVVSLEPTPAVTLEPTPTPILTPTPNATRTPRPSRSPTPTPAPTPTPTPTPAGFTCEGISGNPDRSTTVGSLQPTQETGNWCLERVAYQFFTGSAYGTIQLRLNGRTIASFTCAQDQNCSGPIVEDLSRIRLAEQGDTLRFRVAQCVDPAETPEVNECEGEGVIATIEVGYERAIRP
jgi:hypothetical protein